MIYLCAWSFGGNVLMIYPLCHDFSAWSGKCVACKLLIHLKYKTCGSKEGSGCDLEDLWLCMDFECEQRESHSSSTVRWAGSFLCGRSSVCPVFSGDELFFKCKRGEEKSLNQAVESGCLSYLWQPDFCIYPPYPEAKGEGGRLSSETDHQSLRCRWGEQSNEV